ncbi:hypothetical protein GIB67_033286, partial [Kingdonia uniflora]
MEIEYEIHKLKAEAMGALNMASPAGLSSGPPQSPLSREHGRKHHSPKRTNLTRREGRMLSFGISLHPDDPEVTVEEMAFYN